MEVPSNTKTHVDNILILIDVLIEDVMQEVQRCE